MERCQPLIHSFSHSRCSQLDHSLNKVTGVFITTFLVCVCVCRLLPTGPSQRHRVGGGRACECPGGQGSRAGPQCGGAQARARRTHAGRNQGRCTRASQLQGRGVGCAHEPESRGAWGATYEAGWGVGICRGSTTGLATKKSTATLCPAHLLSARIRRLHAAERPDRYGHSRSTVFLVPVPCWLCSGAQGGQGGVGHPAGPD